MCASINDKNCNYRPCKSFITQNHLLIYGKKHREKIRNTGKTQGKHREFYLGWNVATLKEAITVTIFSFFQEKVRLHPVLFVHPPQVGQIKLGFDIRLEVYNTTWFDFLYDWRFFPQSRDH